MSDVRERPVARSARTEQTVHPIRKIGVVGAGQMGSGIAHVCALSGLHVMLNDIAPERINEGLATINGNLARQVEPPAHQRRASARPRSSTSRRPRPSTNWATAISSSRRRPRRKTSSARSSAALCPALKPETIIGTNTSSISITRLAAATDRPERFIGIHFMNPVPLMELVELIRGIATDDADLRGHQAVHHQARQDRSRCRRIFRPSSSTASCCR